MGRVNMRSRLIKANKSDTPSRAPAYRHSASTLLAKNTISVDIFGALQLAFNLQSARLSPAHLAQARFPRADNLNLLKANAVCYVLDGCSWF